MISKHLKNIFASKELEANQVCAKNAHTATDGKIYTYFIDFSVGDRTNGLNSRL